MEPRHTFKNQTEVFLRSEDNNKCGVRSLNFTTGMNLCVLDNTLHVDKHVKTFCFHLGLLAHPPHTVLERVSHAFDLGRQNPTARRLAQMR